MSDSGSSVSEYEYEPTLQHTAAFESSGASVTSSDSSDAESEARWHAPTRVAPPLMPLPMRSPSPSRSHRSPHSPRSSHGSHVSHGSHSRRNKDRHDADAAAIQAEYERAYFAHARNPRDGCSARSTHSIHSTHSSRSRERERERQRAEAEKEARIMEIVTTDVPLPVPAVCAEYEHVMTEPDRLRQARLRFEEQTSIFDASDIRQVDKLLKDATARREAAAETQLDIDLLAARTAQLARTSNQRWKEVQQMLKEGELRPDDGLFRFLAARQFEMRRDVVNAIEALGELYE